MHKQSIEVEPNTLMESPQLPPKATLQYRESLYEFTQSNNLLCNKKQTFNTVLADERKVHESDIFTLTKVYAGSEVKDVERARICYREETKFKRGLHQPSLRSALLVISPLGRIRLPRRRCLPLVGFPKSTSRSDKVRCAAYGINLHQ